MFPRDELRARHEVELVHDPCTVRLIAGLDGYESVVLGNTLYTGRLHADARRFLSRHRIARS